MAGWKRRGLCRVLSAETAVNQGAGEFTRHSPELGIVSKGVGVDVLFYAGAPGSVFDCVEYALGAHRYIGRMSAASPGKQVSFGLELGVPVIFAEFLQQPGTEH